MRTPHTTKENPVMNRYHSRIYELAEDLAEKSSGETLQRVEFYPDDEVEKYLPQDMAAALQSVRRKVLHMIIVDGYEEREVLREISQNIHSTYEKPSSKEDVDETPTNRCDHWAWYRVWSEVYDYLYTITRYD